MIDFDERLRELDSIEGIVKQIIASGIPEEKLLSQIEIFRKGIPYIVLNRPCTAGDGILKLESNEFPHLLESHSRICKEGRLSKFVPASGAATRMFKSLLAVFYDKDIQDKQALNEAVFEGNKDAVFTGIF